MPDNPLPLSARELILTLTDSTKAQSLSASYLIAAGSLFGLEPNNMRVALARLVKDGALLSVGRGQYGLGSRSGTLNTLVRNWAKAEQTLVAWKGGWLTVLTGHLARSSKTQRRGNERALGLYGFAQAQPGFWVRPANLSRTLIPLRCELIDLGLDENAICTETASLQPPSAVQPETLWPIGSLTKRYESNCQMLASSEQRLAAMNEQECARETLLVGRAVTRDILLDPLLPEPLIDVNARRAMIEAMRSYDRIGKNYWRKLYTRHERSAK